MKKFIAAMAMMFSVSVFAQAPQLKQRTTEDVLKMTDEEFRAETKKELSEIPAEIIPMVCMQVTMVQTMVSASCVANQAEMSEQEQKDCIRLSELLAISVEECKAKVDSLQLNGAQ